MSDAPVTLEYSRDGHAAHLLLNRPDKNNAQSSELIAALADHLETIKAAEDVRVVTVRGAGGVFSAGADLSELKGTIEAGDRAGAGAFLEEVHAMLDDLEALPIPTVAIVEGFALAGGLELLLACDLAICSSDASLGDQHANYGLVAGGGGTQRLPDVVGGRRAKELMFTGRRLEPTEAADWGLVNRVADPEDLDDVVAELVDTLAKKSGNAAALAKHLVERRRDVDRETGLELEREYVREHMFSEAVREGLGAFAEGREPEF